MRKLVYLAVLLAALVAAGYAVADGFRTAASPAAVAGTFSATQVSTSSRTCTSDDGRTIVVTDGTYKGSASGDAALTGAITLRAHAVVDTTNKIGLVNGRLGIDTSSGPDTTAAFQGVWSNGQLAGLATGRVHRRQGLLVANLSADFDPAAGFQNAKLGGGTNGGLAVVQTPRACRQAPSQPEHSAAAGSISALSSSSITVAGLTCALPQGSNVPTTFKQGDVVAITCKLTGGTNTLTRIERRGKH
ncbi:MAG TPA: hypothetical protein VFA82_04410 [Gaiellaceae bacterium]|nr:hypothetical protein [Gaiellaceae bacterium]